MPADRHTRNVTVFPSRPKAKRDRPLRQENQAPRRRRPSQPPRRPDEDEVTYRARILRMHREGKMRRRYLQEQESLPLKRRKTHPPYRRASVLPYPYRLIKWFLPLKEEG